MASVGWYPDPGGQPGQFRYWNGSSWSAETTSTPRQTPPPPGQPAGTPGTTPARGKTSVGVWIGIGAAVLVVALIIWAVVQFLPNLTGGGNPWQPGGNPTQNFCPQPGMNASPSAANTEPGRIAAGHLSFPALGDPWKTQSENEVPFAGLAAEQIALDQPDFDGKGHDWVSQVLVADISSGDGFGSTKAAAERVLACSLGIFYSDTVVGQKPIRSTKYSVSGHDAWLIETDLTFSIPNLKATSERVVIVVVELAASSESYGLYFSSVPNTSPDRLPDATLTLEQLRVDG